MNSQIRLSGPSAIAALLSLVWLSGCSTLVSNAANEFGANLSAAVLNQDDPETAKAAIPSYMVLIDSLLEGNPESVGLLSSAATLYASYGAVFADEPLRASRLTTRARRYALDAMCLRYEDACNWRDMNYEEFTASVAGVTAKDADYLYTYGFATLAYLRAHSSDMDTLAELPEVEALFEHYLSIAGDEVAPSTHTYMGILLTLRPPALGGKPDEARAHFEKAISLSGGRDLSAKVEYARGYAKMLYDRELHDELLEEVMAADPYADGLTLSNVLAKDEAAGLLADADDYF
jgi:hypothetical protein